ncbi:uncharacterized protein PV09_07109 [Verruconis gallopava]|uniref:Uncharacterized protein n=1 Tax=Verruconis gallopava TaxID=253628 RepID=A0A0D1YKE0_9PEZI|nr:uncharacterized protein PV09_07109 [Verruconis gallopava]KIW01337.1 hypothetical protein PV09_07109 [Verruconis gallopava]
MLEHVSSTFNRACSFRNEPKKSSNVFRTPCNRLDLRYCISFHCCFHRSQTNLHRAKRAPPLVLRQTPGSAHARWTKQVKRAGWVDKLLIVNQCSEKTGSANVK